LDCLSGLPRQTPSFLALEWLVAISATMEMMQFNKLLIWRISDFLRRLFSRGSELGGVPLIGVREPRHRNPSGRGAAVAAREPEESLVSAIAKR